MKKSIFILFAFLFSPLAVAKGYQDIIPPQPTETGDKIEVVEVFWYGCPHCYKFEPYLEKWLQNKPEDVEFRRMPGIFRKSWIPHARAYYTAIKMGVADKIHRPLFDALHKERRKIFDEKALKRFFVEHGVDGDEFTRIYNSNEVDTKIKQAFIMGQRYKITGVPSIVINGKYLTSSTLAGSHANVLKIIDELVDKERGAAKDE